MGGGKPKGGGRGNRPPSRPQGSGGKGRPGADWSRSSSGWDTEPFWLRRTWQPARWSREQRGTWRPSSQPVGWFRGKGLRPHPTPDELMQEHLQARAYLDSIESREFREERDRVIEASLRDTDRMIEETLGPISKVAQTAGA